MTTVQKDAADPQLRQQLDAKIKKYDEAWNNNEAAALAAFFTEEAVYVTDRGPICSREAIETHFTDLFQTVHFSGHIANADQDSPHITGTVGNEMWATGKWSHTFQVQNGNPTQANGYWQPLKFVTAMFGRCG